MTRDERVGGGQRAHGVAPRRSCVHKPLHGMRRDGPRPPESSRVRTAGRGRRHGTLAPSRTAIGLEPRPQVTRGQRVGRAFPGWGRVRGALPSGLHPDFTCARGWSAR
jgi:hypothetical protein